MRDAETGVLGETERAELERLRQVISTGPTGLVAIDGAGLIRSWNPAAERLLGWPAADIIGRPLIETVIPPELRAAHAAGMERHLRTGETVVIGHPSVLPALHRDGHRVEVELTVWPARARGERQFYAFLRDTAGQRAAAERAARRTAALLATIEAQRAVTAVAYDRDLALRVLAEHTAAAFPSATGAAVELLTGDELRTAAATGSLAGQPGRWSPVDPSLSGVAVTRRAPVRRGSLCVAPLLQGERVIGVLTVAGDRPEAFDADDAHHLELLAGSLTSALVHADDFAQRIRALDALEASETRFRLIFDNSPLGLALVSVAPDSFGRFLQTNSAMSAITGYRADELAGMTFVDLHHPDEAAATAQAMRRMIGDGIGTIRAERRYVHKDDRTIWASVRIAVVSGAGGVPSCLVVQAEDVTAQREATARLHQQAKLLELIPAAVIVRDPDGTIRWWNAGATELYGRPLAEARGRSTHRLLGTTFADGGSPAEQAAALVTVGHWEGHLHHRTSDGRTRTVLSRQVVHQPADGPAQVLEVNTDVTAARAAEQARDLAAATLAERNAELEKADRLKLEMMRILGHEISNPLAAIVGYSDLLADEIDAVSATGRAIGAISRQAERLDDVVREMLAMVSIDTGNVQAVREEVPVRAELAKILAGSAGRVPVAGPDAVVLFHPGHLRQIMANLLSNADKYAGGATAVTVEPAGDRVLIRLADDGPGVPEDFRPRLFDRLARAERDAGSKGTGLGLYIVRSLARANGGEARHEPGPAGGSVFVIEAERAPGPADRRPPAPE